MKRILAAAATVAVASLTPLTSIADAASTNQTPQDTSLQIYYSSGKSSPLVKYAKPGSTATKALARSMGYIDWGGCWQWSDSTDVITAYPARNQTCNSKSDPD